jgi:hypothetical protein
MYTVICIFTPSYLYEVIMCGHIKLYQYTYMHKHKPFIINISRMNTSPAEFAQNPSNIKEAAPSTMENPILALDRS